MAKSQGATGKLTRSTSNGTNTFGDYDGTKSFLSSHGFTNPSSQSVEEKGNGPFQVSSSKPLSPLRPISNSFYRKFNGSMSMLGYKLFLITTLSQ